MHRRRARAVSVRALLLLAAPCALVPAAVAGAQAPADTRSTGTAADRAAVRQAAMDYIDGFYTGDSTRLVRSVHPTVHKYGYSRRAADTAYRGMAMPYEGFMRYAAGVREGRTKTPANAPREVQLLDVQDQTAAVKVTAWWGTDYLLLARLDGRWMITHVLWQSPPPAPSR